MRRGLMLAAGEKRGDDVKIGDAEQKMSARARGLRGFQSRRASLLRGFNEQAEMMIARHGAQMVQADAREGGDFLLGEEFLARSYRWHVQRSLGE